MNAWHKIIFFLLLIYFHPGARAQIKIPVHVFELGQKITEQLAKNYAGSLVRSAWKVNTNSIWSYEIRIIRGNIEYTLLYDKDGKFLRKESVAPVVVEKKIIIHKKLPKPDSDIFLPIMPLPAPDSLVLRY